MVGTFHSSLVTCPLSLFPCPLIPNGRLHYCTRPSAETTTKGNLNVNPGGSRFAVRTRYCIHHKPVSFQQCHIFCRRSERG